MLPFSRRVLGPMIVVTPDHFTTPTEMMLKAKVGAWTALVNVIGMSLSTVMTLSAPPWSTLCLPFPPSRSAKGGPNSPVGYDI